MAVSGHCSLGLPRSSWPVRGRFALHNTVALEPPRLSAHLPEDLRSCVPQENRGRLCDIDP